jgi:hypothetical protein
MTVHPARLLMDRWLSITSFTAEFKSIQTFSDTGFRNIFPTAEFI